MYLRKVVWYAENLRKSLWNKRGKEIRLPNCRRAGLETMAENLEQKMERGREEKGAKLRHPQIENWLGLNGWTANWIRRKRVEWRRWWEGSENENGKKKEEDDEVTLKSSLWLWEREELSSAGWGQRWRVETKYIKIFVLFRINNNHNFENA